MTAAEARAIADQVAARRLARGFLMAIEETAKDGRYEYQFGMIEPSKERALTLLGFRVTTDTSGNVTVSWADAGRSPTI